MKPKSIEWLCPFWTALVAALLLVAAPAKATETLTFIHTDVAGSPIAATDVNGNAVWREGYRPYGERTRNQAAAANNREFFHGKAFDADTGLSYFGARYYDPIVGRFMGVDAVGFQEGNLHSFNRYAYGNNNPYKYRDPDGSAGSLILDVGVPVLIGYVYYATRPPEQQQAMTHSLKRAINGIFNENANESASSGVEADGASHEGGIKDVTKRPSRVRKGTEQANWDNAADGDDGKLCPTCGKEVKAKPGEKGKDWDNDHVVPWRHRDLTGKDRKEVLDEYNRDTRLRCVDCNRSDNAD